MMHCTMKIADFDGTFRRIRASATFFTVLCGNYTLFWLEIAVFSVCISFKGFNPC